jgi:hypothetical protein
MLSLPPPRRQISFPPPKPCKTEPLWLQRGELRAGDGQEGHFHMKEHLNNPHRTPIEQATPAHQSTHNGSTASAFLLLPELLLPGFGGRRRKPQALQLPDRLHHLGHTPLPAAQTGHQALQLVAPAVAPFLLKASRKGEGRGGQ